jgi:signal transduction histidine kinase
MKKVLFLLIFVTSFANAQRQKIDSLLMVLHKFEAMPPSISKDTMRVLPLKKLMYYYTYVIPDSALYYTQQLLAISQKRNITKNIIYCYNYFGYLYNLEGNYFLGANSYFQALTLAEKINDPKQILQCKRLLSESYFSLEDYPKALKYGQEALDLARSQKNIPEELNSLINKGGIYIKQGYFEKAKKIFEEAFQKAILKKDDDYIALSLNSLGLVANELKNYDEAIDLFKKEIKYYEPTTIRYANAQIEISRSLMAKYQYKEAISLLLFAQKIAKQDGNDSLLPKIYQLLYECYKAQGNTNQALHYNEKFMVLKDSLAKESTQKRINSLQLEYDNTQKESQLQKKNIELLEEKTQSQQLTQTRNLFLGGGVLAVLIAGILFWNNKKLNVKNQQIELQKTQILLAQEQLENANQTLEFRVNERTKELETANNEIKTAVFTGQSIERKRVASELHDNLSSLLSALKMSLQAIKTDNLTDSEKKIYGNIKEMMGNAYSEVRNISHNIMPEGLERDGLNKIVEKLVEKLNQNQQLSFKFIAKNMTERPPMAIELNLYSIILELINNIIKHADATQASIEMTKEIDFLIVKVSDNGKGLDTTKSSDGTGLGNIKARLDAMNGTISVTSDAKKMTVFEIKIPIS